MVADSRLFGQVPVWLSLPFPPRKFPAKKVFGCRQCILGRCPHAAAAVTEKRRETDETILSGRTDTRRDLRGEAAESGTVRLRGRGTERRASQRSGGPGGAQGGAAR